MDKQSTIEQLLELRREQVAIMRQGVRIIGCLAGTIVILFTLALTGVAWLVLFLLGASGMLQ